MKRGDKNTNNQRNGMKDNIHIPQSPAAPRFEAGEEIYRRLVEKTPAAIIIYQGNDIKYVNHGVEMLTGFSSEELLQMNFWEYAHPDFQNIVKERGLGRQVGKNIPSLYEYKIITKTGEVRWIQTQPSFFEFEGKPAAIATVFDITKRKSAERELQESENKFRTLADSTAASIFIIRGSQFLYVNHGLERLSGYSATELLKMKIWDVVHPDFREWVRKGGMTGSIEKNPLRRYEIMMARKDGEARWIEMQLAYMEYSGGPATIGTAFDTTERKRAETRLLESERRLSDILDFLPDATFVISKEGVVTLWNQAMTDLTGIKAEDMLGKKDYEYAIPFYGDRRPILIDIALKPKNRMPARYSMQMENGNKISGEAYMPKMAGGNVYLSATAAPLHDADGNIIGAIESTHDITRRKKIEEILEMARAELELRVEERTADLSAANKSLSTEISERKKIMKALRKKERELREKSENLERANMALTVLLKRREEDKTELEEKVLSNVKELILPYLEKLKHMKLSRGQMDYVGILESHINDIVSPFLQNLKSTYINLTPREIEIANLVKEGKTTKSIAVLLGCSTQAVDFHRFNIRNKLGMKNKKANLRTRLLSLT